ncbi:HalOD1 output domain-containing protein [Salinigranum sp. GCM10025319]|uniref:HalOD1 output domain-containing protein n=1 Tax=Salinigranum sp. GCM10025319 TaxID=3252687 RepID=UPI003622F254
MSEDRFAEELLDIVTDGDRVQVYARRDDLSASSLVVAAVAAVDGIEPSELTELAAVVDPDALDRLFETGRATSGFVRFEFAGHEVTVHDDAHLTVR